MHDRWESSFVGLERRVVHLEMFKCWSVRQHIHATGHRLPQGVREEGSVRWHGRADGR